MSLFCESPRPGSAYKLVRNTSDWGSSVSGRVAIVTNSNTGSEPEAFTAVCKEYKRARVFGERTAGALNGWTIAINLPEHFARFAVPYTCGVSPKGVEYEEIGVDPDEVIVNSADDFSANRDQPLVRAIQYVTVAGRA